MKDLACARCGAAFACGAEEPGCWCEGLPPLAPLAGRDCLCRACLEHELRERSAPDPRP
ncbi:MAG TPA: cysteine-rich CWC family protein [Burkholderiales bacterium]|nr:cysteine-rich CWC family protein [Burkholderiales bacterium]